MSIEPVTKKLGLLGFIAAARRTSDEDWGVRVVILEQAGGAYITKWLGDELLGEFNFASALQG